MLVGCAVSDAGSYLCYFGALDRGPIALAVLTHYIAPVVVALLAPMLLREPLTRVTAMALIVSLCGALGSKRQTPRSVPNQMTPSRST